MRRVLSPIAILASVLLMLAALGPGVLAEHEDPVYDCQEQVDDDHDDGKKAKKPKKPKLDKHPIVGTWLVESSPEDPANSLELIIFGPGGTVMNIGDDLNWAGSWAPTGKCSIEATFQSLANDPEAGFLGLTTVRTSVAVSEDGESFAGTFTVELPAGVVEAGEMPAGQLGPGEVTAHRVNVEPMGEPVGPWPPPDPFFAQANAICDEAGKQIGALGSPGIPGWLNVAEDGTWQEIADHLERVTDAIVEARDRLTEMSPPPEDAGIGEFLSVVDGYIELTSDGVAALRAEDSAAWQDIFSSSYAADANLAEDARQVGLPRCSRLVVPA